jgi:Zn-dependent peptidase ImmA (M78 family)
MVDPWDLKKIFGEEITASSPEEFAARSGIQFIRGQDHLALYRGWGDGHVLSAFEAYKTFGFEKLVEALEEGSAVIVDNIEEPAKTIRERREALGIDHRDLSLRTNLTLEEVQGAENPKKSSRVQNIEKISRTLGLDDGKIGFLPGSGGDNRLAYRLKTLASQREPDQRPTFVFALTEVAWVILAQMRLFRWLTAKSEPRWKVDFSSRAGQDSTKEPWEMGFELAHETRSQLGFNLSEPIPSMRDLCNQLEIPYIQTKFPELGTKISGATVVSGEDKGICINLEGFNANVWVRRSTIAHELSHLLWDPVEFLTPLKVEYYDQLENRTDAEAIEQSRQKTHLEQRANAFAVEFLAPQKEVKSVFQNNNSLRDVMMHFGIGYVASKNQVRNAFNLYEDLAVDDAQPTAHWRQMEDLPRQLDTFDIPPSHKGFFSAAVVEAENRKLISPDTAAQYLSCPSATYPALKTAVLEAHRHEIDKHLSSTRPPL